MAIKGAEELDGVNFYEQIQKVRDGYAFLAVHYQQDESEASEPLKKGKFVLVHQDGHKDQEEPILTCYKGGKLHFHAPTGALVIQFIVHNFGFWHILYVMSHMSP